jgi:CRP-like cAMP-binding protein
MLATRSEIHPLIAKLQSIFTLTDDERAMIEAMPMQVVNLRENQDIVREGDRPSRSCLLLEGFTCTYKITGDGKRQIQAFHIPGDVPDLQSLHLKVLDNSVGTLTPCRVGFVQHEALRELCHRNPRVADAFWRSTLIDASIFREWITSIGRRDALSRVSHVLCEFIVRLKAVGLAQDHSCDLPVTQTEFADALGLSTVHINRTLQELRGSGLISLKGSFLQVMDWDGLKEAGDFDAAYLHLETGHIA